ncbi:MAG: YdbL family protein [Candidatus Omnitrophica bacterium]|nr:YdbL family protein [Candidatus Omnitrophota bacterium]
MKTMTLLIGTFLLTLGCANVRMEAPKDPIKLDVSMRLDVYQHVESDIDKIENTINSPSKKGAKVLNKTSLLDIFVDNAYAQELSPEAESAVARRQARHSDLVSWEEKGVVGENRSGLVEIKGSKNDAVQGLVDSENNDRMVIYKAVADKNGTSIDSVQSLYAKKLQSNASPGTPVEGNSGWSVK